MTCDAPLTSDQYSTLAVKEEKEEKEGGGGKLQLQLLADPECT